MTRAQSLRQETALNSITPERAGGIMYDTAALLNQQQLQGTNPLLISKIYASIEAMEADDSPVSDITGEALRAGQIVVISTSQPDEPDEGLVYRFNGIVEEVSSWTCVGKIGSSPYLEGYQFMGKAVLTPTPTDPGVPTQKVFYQATEPGTYTNFGGIVVADGEVVNLKWDGTAWSKEITGAATSARVENVREALGIADVPSYAFANLARIDLNHLVDSSDWTYKPSSTFDAGWVRIFQDAGKIVISGAAPYRITFYNSADDPSPANRISSITVSYISPDGNDIPAGTKLAIINFRHVDNTGGYDALRVTQPLAGATKKELAAASDKIDEQLNVAKVDLGHVVSSTNWEYVTSTTFDAALVNITGGKFIQVKGAVVARIVFFNSTAPSGASYISNVLNKQAAAVPAGAKLAIVNLRKADNVAGYDNMRIYQAHTAALNEDTQLNYKALLIGSSFGVNTICQFPYFCEAAGLGVLCGNLYKSSAGFSDIVDIINGEASWSTGSLYLPHSHTWSEGPTDFVQMLQYTEWDAVIIGRNAAQRKTWNATMEANLQTIIEYIQAHVKGTPKILFAPSFAYPAFSTDKTAQLTETEQVNATALQMQAQFGLEIIPVATAVQNARMTELMGVGAAPDEAVPDMAGDSNHLDIGVGSYATGALMFEWLIGSRLSKSVITNTYTPKSADITSMGIFPASKYTQPTARDMMIIKYCALMACRDPYVVNDQIGARFPFVEN